MKINTPFKAIPTTLLVFSKPSVVKEAIVPSLVVMVEVEDPYSIKSALGSIVELVAH